MKKRTNIDFSSHELTVIENEHVTIHTLKKPGTVVHMIKYVNVAGKLMVTGDFGNWMFCRSFIPSENEYVSDGYWLEKLAISSTQVGEEFSETKTIQEIKERLAECGSDKKYKGYLKECLGRIEGDSSDAYKAWAYENYPDHMDYECVPYATDTKFWLKVVFDGFDEMCKRLSINPLTQQ